MVRPRISIIIPTFNQLEKHLKPCIESIIKYTNLDNKEIIVVCNGCTDGTEQYLESLNTLFNVVFISCREAIGYPKAVNLGIKIARGDYIVLLNNDTILLEQGRDQWINLMLIPFIDPTTAVSGPLELRHEQHQFIVFFCAMIRRSMFDEIGLLDETFSPGGCEDIDFCIKARQKGYEVRMVPNPEVHRVEGKIVVGNFPIYHYGEGTFEHDKGYSEHFAKNALIIKERYK